MYKYTDKQILDWLGNNYFHREKDDWDTKYHKGYTQWVFFAPEGRQGDIRWVIEGAMERQGVEQNED